MKKLFLLFVIALLFKGASAQKIESIHINLYTDSLKKGFYNYINVDGKSSDGTWIPLDSTHLRFTANTGYFKGNDLFIDSSYTGETVHVKVMLKSNPSLTKEVDIYIRKRGFDEPLRTNEQVLDDLRNNRKKPKQKSA